MQNYDFLHINNDKMETLKKHFQVIFYNYTVVAMPVLCHNAKMMADIDKINIQPK